MKYYIDPGTGSMLFAVLIGLIGSLNYLVRLWIMKLKSLSGRKDVEKNENVPLVIYADSKRYWNVFEPICRELDQRDFNVVYYTQSPDDPALNCDLKHFTAKFIGEDNRAFAKMNFVAADIVLSTTPGLGVYQWKRSKDVKCYVHILHACNEVLTYRMFGIDYYDTIFVSGDYMIRDVRNLEKLRGLPEKEIYMAGIPYMDEMKKRLESYPAVKNEETTVLLAPSWGPSSIFSKMGSSIIDELLKTGYKIIVRPHPQSYVSEKEMLEGIIKKYEGNDRVVWNRDNDNFEVLRIADILISDFSGVTFDFALVYDKPIIYADTEFDRAPYDIWWVDTPFWTLTALPRIGMKLTKENMGDLKQMIDTCLEDPRFAQGREEVRKETWQYPGEGAKRAAEYLIEKYKSLNNGGEQK